MNVPAQIDGPVLISDDELEGVDLPFGQPNPYAKFKELKPSAVLDGGVLVYDGHFDMSAASQLVKLATAAAKQQMRPRAGEDCICVRLGVAWVRR